MSGQVWLYNPDANEWASVERNQPLTTGDRIATDNGARRDHARHDDAAPRRGDRARGRPPRRQPLRRPPAGGSVAARLRNPQSLAEFEIDTDEGRFRVQTVGRYRFDRFDQASDLTVFNGQAIFENRNTALPVTTGQHAQFWLDAGGVPQYAMVEPVRDAFAGLERRARPRRGRVATPRRRASSRPR